MCRVQCIALQEQGSASKGLEMTGHIGHDPQARVWAVPPFRSCRCRDPAGTGEEKRGGPAVGGRAAPGRTNIKAQR